MTPRNSLRLPATLLFAGVLILFLSGIGHPDRENANDHTAAFAEYAKSDHWTAIHLGQFAGMTALLLGIFTFFTAGGDSTFGAGLTVASLGLYAVLQAVDGVALKQAVDAWAHAPPAERIARFANAETIRWLEWGVRSYQSFVLGLTLVFFAIEIARKTRECKPVACLIALSGAAYMAQGWVIGSEGFSASNQAPNLAGIVLISVWSLWFLIIVWKKERTCSTN